MDLNGVAQTVASLSDYGAGGGTVTNRAAAGSPAVLTLGTTSGTATCSGAIGDGTSTMGLIKTGNSTQILAGASTYSGGTTINAGTLRVNGQTGSNSGTGSGAVVVNASGTLSGNGRIAGAVTVASGSTAELYPNSSSTLTLGGNLTFGGSSAGATFDLSSSASTGNDKVVLESKTLTCGGAQITINSAGTLDSNDYVLFDAGSSGTISGSFNPTPVFVGTTPKYSSGYSVVTGTRYVTLHYTPIPITVTAAANSKTYDGTTSAAATPTITAGALASGDTATSGGGLHRPETRAREKTLTPTAIIENAGGNDVTASYNITFVNSTAGTISAKALTVSGITAASTTYDGTTTAKLGGTAAFQTAEAPGTGTTSDGTPYTVDSVSPGTVTGTLAAKNVGTQNVTTSVAVTGSGSGNYTVTPQAGLTQQVTQMALTVTATGVNKTYDGSTSATVTLSDNRVSGDAVTDSYTSASFATASVGTGKPMSVSGISISGGDAGNYSLGNTTASTTANITAATVTVSSGITANNKVYDGTTAATISANNVVLGGVAAGDAANVTLSTNGYSASFASAPVGTGKTVTVSGLTLTGSAAGNYTLTQPSLTANITAKALTALGTLVFPASKVYDGTTTATPTSGAAALQATEAAGAGSTADGKPYSVDAVSLTGTASYNYNSKAVATATTITESGLSLTGTGSGNYTLTVPTFSSTITARSLTVTATGVNKPYDGTTTATVTLSDNKVSGDAVTDSYTSASFASASAGTGKTVSVSGISISGADVGNYSLANTTATTTANITVLPVQLSGTRTYDGTPLAAAGILTVVNNVDGANLTLSGTATLTNNDVGSQAITPGTVARVQSAAGSVGSSAASSFSVTVATPANGNTLIAVISTRGTSAGRVSSITQTGATWTRASQAANANGTTTEIWYAPGVSGAGTTVTINLAASLFASAVVAEYSGVLAVSPLDQTNNATGSSTAAVTGTTPTTTEAGELWIGGIGLTNSSYTLGSPLNSFTAFTNSASTSGTAGNNARVYALEKIVTSTGAASSGGTVSSSSQWSGAIATFYAPSSSLALGGSAAGNYTLTGLSGSVTITPKALTMSGLSVPASKVYDGTTTAVVTGSPGSLQTAETAGSGTTSDGTPYLGDTVSLTGTATGTYNSKDVASATTVTFGGVSLTGAQAANYALTIQTPASATITPKALTALDSLVFPASKVYDGTTTATPTSGAAALQATEAAGAGTTSDGIPYSVDSVSLTGTASYNYNAKDVATATTVTESGLSLTGTGSGNYALTAPSFSSKTITAKVLTAVGTLVFPASKVYDGTTTATPSGAAALQAAEAAGAGTAADGAPYSVDTVSLTGTASYTYNTKDVATATTVTESGLSLTGTGSGNYTLTAPSFSGKTITTKALTAVGTLVFPASKAYDGTTTATPTSGAAALQATEAAGAGSTADGKPYSVDTVSLTGTASYNYNSKAVATATTITESGLSLTGTGSGDYTLTAPSFSSTITARSLTVTATGVNKPYDGTTTATVTLSDNKLSGDAVTDSYTSASFASASAGTGKTVTVSGILISGADSGNYTLANTTATTTANITVLPVQLSGTRTYDGTPLAASGILTVVNNVDGANLTLSGTATLANNDVGSQAITPGTVARVQSATGAVGSSAATSFTVTVATPANGNTLIAVISTRGTSSGRVSSITQTGATWSRASQSTGTAGTTTEIWYAPGVSGAGTTVTINLASSLFASAVVAEYSGVLTVGPLDQAANSTGNSAAAVTGTTPTTIQAGELWIGGIGLVNSGYTLTSPLNSFASIGPATSGSTTASSNARVYALEKIVTSTGAASSGGTVSTSSQWSGAIATFYAPASSLALGGSAAGNYTLTGMSGSVTITAKALTMSGLSVPTSKVYDGTTAAVVSGSPGALQAAEAVGSGTTSDGKPYTGDTVSLTGTATGTYNSKDVASATTVTFGGVSLTGAQAADYALTIQSPASATITPAALTITANNQTKTYGTTLTLGAGQTAFTSSALQDSEAVGTVTLTASGGTSAYDAIGTYTLTPSAATGGTFTAGDYTITYVNGTVTVVPGALDHYAVSASSPQTAGAAFTVTVTAQDSFNNTVTSDSSTQVTLTSTGSLQFDSNGNGVFGEANDNKMTPTNGTFTIQAKDTAAETVNLTATDANSKTGTLTGLVISPLSNVFPFWRTVTINHSKVVGFQTNFPVLISITDSALAAHAKANGFDILFIASDGSTILPYERESYTSATGALLAWVNVPYLSSTTDTVLYVYYGNPNAADQQNRTGAWDPYFKAVWHLDEVGNGTAGEYKDSTTSANNAQGKMGSDQSLLSGAPSQAAGKIGPAQYFTASDQQFIESANNIGITNNTVRTITFWTEVTTSNRMSWVGWGSNISNGEFEAALRPNPITSLGQGQLFLWGYGANDWQTGVSPLANGWHYHAIVYDGIMAHWYLDGSPIVSTNYGTNGFTHTYGTYDSHVYLGYEYDVAGQNSVAYLDGYLDEVHIANTNRSLPWIQTEYYNQADPTHFTTLGSEQTMLTNIVTSSANPSVYGQAVSFTATLTWAAGTPAGTVQFLTNGANFGAPVTLVNGIATSAAVATLPAGTTTVTAVYTDTGGTTWNTSNGTLTNGQVVYPAPLTITANNAAKTYGQTATFSGTAFAASGLQNGETVGSVTISSGGAPATAAVGSYSIVPSAATGGTFRAANYTITYTTTGTLTVGPKALTVTANSSSKAYGQAVTFAGTEFTTTGLTNSDTVATVALASSGVAAIAPVGNYAIVPSSASGSGLTNYTISYVNGTLTVSPKALTVTAVADTKTYDGTWRRLTVCSLEERSSGCKCPDRWLFLTDTIPISDEKRIPQLSILSVAPLLGEAIKRIHRNGSREPAIWVRTLASPRTGKILVHPALNFPVIRGK